MGQVSPEVVDALYRALLGRSAEPAAIDHWASAPSADDIIAAIVETPQFQRRVVTQAALINAEKGSRREEVEVRRHTRLLSGGGLTAVGDLPEETSWIELLRTLPIRALSRSVVGGSVVVLGPYARQLAEELLARGEFAKISAGLDALGQARPDVLVLTDPFLPDALRWSHPHLFHWIRRRVVTPVLASIGPEAGLYGLALERQREELHKSGFLEVARLAYFPFGDLEEVVDVTHANGSDPRETVERSPASPRSPVAWWLVANRVPYFGRP